MKVSDFVFRFKSFGRYDGLCRVRTFLTEDRRIVAVASDLAE
jgi:hypothetical protein